jgi:hypothetical protein
MASTQQTTPTLSQKRIQQNIDDEKTMLMDPETLLPGGGGSAMEQYFQSWMEKTSPKAVLAYACRSVNLVFFSFSV